MAFSFFIYSIIFCSCTPRNGPFTREAYALPKCGRNKEICENSFENTRNNDRSLKIFALNKETIEGVRRATLNFHKIGLVSFS